MDDDFNTALALGHVFDLVRALNRELPQAPLALLRQVEEKVAAISRVLGVLDSEPDRKSTRLNSSHMSISYAVFCLKKKINTAQCRHRRCRIASCVNHWAGDSPRSSKRACKRIRNSASTPQVIWRASSPRCHPADLD